MEFRLLGPLEVLRDGHRLPRGGAKQRALLALLLLHANEVVSRDRLLEELWGDRPPGTAGHSLDVQISRLRKALQPDELLLTRDRDSKRRATARTRSRRALLHRPLDILWIVIAAADKALYRAKANGRNRLEAAD